MRPTHDRDSCEACRTAHVPYWDPSEPRFDIDGFAIDYLHSTHEAVMLARVGLDRRAAA